MSNPTIDKTVRASSQVLDVALDALRDANEWGIGEQIQGMVFRDVKVRITGSKFVVDAETSGWRYLPGSFPGLWTPYSLLIQGTWHIEYEATHDLGGTFKGTGTWSFGTELEPESYPEVWSHVPSETSRTGS